MSVTDGGPAFPASIGVSATGDVYHGYDGMSLRDWFAGQALPSLIAVNGAHSHATADEVDACRLALAKRAYGFADAMLAAREK